MNDYIRLLMVVGVRAKSFRKWIPVEVPKDDVAKITKVSIGLAE